MFKKLVSNLPYNPDLIDQVAFYAGRMHKEDSVRRSGLILLALALALQVFAAVSPPEPSLAASNNDIIRGGFTGKSQAVNLCRNNTQNFRDILAYYQVTCEHLEEAETATLKSTAYNKRLDSLGRLPQGEILARTGKPTDEYKVNIDDNDYYMRNLWSWDSRASSSYKVLKLENESGRPIMIMFSCGNIVTIGKYKPPVPPEPSEPEPELPQDACPNLPGIQTDSEECYPCPEAADNDSVTACLKLSKTAANQTQGIDEADGTMAFGGDIIVYNLKAANEGSQTVKDFIMDENMSDTLEYADVIKLDGGELDPDKNVVWPAEDIEAGATLSKSVTVRVKDPLPQTPVSASDPSSYDLVMTNVFYGNSVQIELPASVVKSTELVVEKLPRTGPGNVIAAGFLITTLSSYFLARSRLLAKELDQVRKDFVAYGGNENE